MKKLLSDLFIRDLVKLQEEIDITDYFIDENENLISILLFKSKWNLNKLFITLSFEDTQETITLVAKRNFLFRTIYFQPHLSTNFNRNKKEVYLETLNIFLKNFNRKLA